VNEIEIVIKEKGKTTFSHKFDAAKVSFDRGIDKETKPDGHVVASHNGIEHCTIEAWNINAEFIDSETSMFGTKLRKRNPRRK